MICAVAIHHICKLETGERLLFYALVRRRLDQMDQKALDQRHYIFLGHKSHLQVKLSKFWLPI